ncbi:MAG: hypothetical protein Q7S40_34795 [Opitutaceae bacterium]|nr:hypothetical protein [Opitutaceae bacterium]
MRTWLDSADAAPFEKWSASERLWGIQAKLRRIEELTASKAADAVRTSGSRSVDNMVAGRLAAITVATSR